MSESLTVSVADEVRAGYATAGALASLPISYQHGGKSAAEDVTVVGGCSGWPGAVAGAVRAGARAVIVIAPEPADLSPLRSPDCTGSLIVIDSRWASNPAVASAGAAFRSAVTAGTRFECRVLVGTARSLPAVLLDQLSLVRALLAPATELRILHRSEHGFVGEALAAGISVDLSATRTEAVPEQASARLLTAEGAVHLLIPDGGTARPALLTVTGPDGAVLAPTIYESGHRAALRRLHRLLVTDGRSTDIDDLEADITTASIYTEDQNPYRTP
jgi:hypothetical protein